MQIAATLAVARPAGRQLAYDFYFPPSHFGLRSAEANDRPVRGWRHDGAAAHISHFGDLGVFAGVEEVLTKSESCHLFTRRRPSHRVAVQVQRVRGNAVGTIVRSVGVSGAPPARTGAVITWRLPGCSGSAWPTPPRTHKECHLKIGRSLTGKFRLCICLITTVIIKFLRVNINRLADSRS